MGREAEDLIFFFVVWGALIVSWWLMMACGEKCCFGLAEISFLVFLLLFKDGMQDESRGRRDAVIIKVCYNVTKLRWEILLQFCPQVSQPFLRIGPTPQKIKTTPLQEKKTIKITTISPITSRRSTYFHSGAPSLMSSRVLNATLPNNFL